MGEKYRIINVFLDDRNVVRQISEANHDKTVAIFDLIVENFLSQPELVKFRNQVLLVKYIPGLIQTCLQFSRIRFLSYSCIRLTGFHGCPSRLWDPM